MLRSITVRYTKYAVSVYCSFKDGDCEVHQYGGDVAANINRACRYFWIEKLKTGFKFYRAFLLIELMRYRIRRMNYCTTESGEIYWDIWKIPLDSADEGHNDYCNKENVPLTYRWKISWHIMHLHWAKWKIFLMLLLTILSRRPSCGYEGARFVPVWHLEQSGMRLLVDKLTGDSICQQPIHFGIYTIRCVLPHGYIHMDMHIMYHKRVSR